MSEAQKKESYADYLHRYGLKNTKHRQLVLQLLLQKQGVLTAEEVYKQLLAVGEIINFSTVYRILEMFTQKGLTEKSFLSNSRKYGFTLHTMGHRHRLICLRCHAVIEVEHCPIAEFEQRLSQTTAFDIVGHNLEWYGYCPACQRKQEKQK